MPVDQLEYPGIPKINHINHYLIETQNVGQLIQLEKDFRFVSKNIFSLENPRMTIFLRYS